MTRLASLAPALALCWAALAGSAAAQQQQVPPSAEPGRLEQRFAPPVQPRATDRPLLPSPDAPLPPAEAEGIRFVLNDVMIEGATVYGPETLRAYYADSLGREVSLATLYEIARAIQTRYRNDGYILAQVFPPAQTVDNGVVRLQVLEGYIHKVEVEGEAPRHADLIASYVERIKADRPLSNATLERYLLLLNDLPGLQAKALLLPSFEQPGASDLVLQVESRRLAFAAQADNRGTRFIGPYQLLAGMEVFSPFQQADRLGIRYITTSQTEELRYLDVGYGFPIFRDGTFLELSGIINEANPGFTLDDLDVDSHNESATVQVVHPLVRARRHNISLRAAFTARDTYTDLGEQRLSEDRIRFLTVGASADLADELRGISLVDVAVSQGLDVLNPRESGSAHLTRPNGRHDFTKIELEAARLQRLTETLRLLVAARGQYAFSQMLASEEFGFGGANFGRAFDPSEYSGDHGAAGKVELQLNHNVGMAYLERVQWYAYYDYGTVWRIESTFDEGRDSASALGAGLRFTINEHVSGYLEAAKPLVGRVAARGDDGTDPRLFFTLSARF